MGELIDQVDQRLGPLSQQREGAAEQDRHQQHLQDVALHEAADERIGNQLEEERCNASRFHLLGGRHVRRHGRRIERFRIHIHAVAGPEQIGQCNAQRQRNRRDDFKVDDGLAAYAPNLLQLAGAADPHHHDREDDRRDQHLDQLQKTITERLQLLRKFGRPDAQRDAHRQGNQNLPEQRARKALHGESSFGLRVSQAAPNRLVRFAAIVVTALFRSLDCNELLRRIVER